jgi:adenosylcobinamide-phosphate synthase
MDRAAIVLAALLLDMLLGDPQGWPHPVRAIGWLVVRAEPHARQMLSSARLAGAVLALGVTAATWGAAWLLIVACKSVHPMLGIVARVGIITTCLGARDLAAHAMRVWTPLATGDLPQARQAVGMMVSRDTEHLDASDVSRATIESVAENAVDGVLAPILFALLLGAPAALAFKAVSTMDSMIGKRDARYITFGTAAARTDDVLNWIPARLSLPLIALGGIVPGADPRRTLAVGWRFRSSHASPNSAWAEAAFAGALDLRLGGEDRYSGNLRQHPHIGEGPDPEPRDIRRAVQLLWATVLVVVALIGGFVTLLR